MKYTSISRNMRGFNFQSDFDSVEAWKKQIDSDRSGNRETEWSLLLRYDGEAVWRYRRGMGREPVSLPS